MKLPGQAAHEEMRLALPLIAVFVGFFVLPLCVLVVISLTPPASGASVFAQYAKFLGDAFYLEVLWNTILLGLQATALCLLCSYPLAWTCSRSQGNTRLLLVFLMVLPLLTSVVVRTFSWIVILGREGIFNRTLAWLHFIDEPIKLLFTEAGLVLVLAQVFIPVMALPILASLDRIDPNLASASAALGAGDWQTLWRITLPLSGPGVVAGCILTFAGCTTAFITQTLIGGARLLYVPLYLYQQAVGANDWPYAAAIAVVFIAAILGAVMCARLTWRAARQGKQGAGA